MLYNLFISWLLPPTVGFKCSAKKKREREKERGKKNLFSRSLALAPSAAAAATSAAEDRAEEAARARATRAAAAEVAVVLRSLHLPDADVCGREAPVGFFVEEGKQKQKKILE